MGDTRNQPGKQGSQEQGGRRTETERQREGQGGNVDPNRQAVPNPRRVHEEPIPSRTDTDTETGTEQDIEKDPGRQNAG